MPTEWGTRDRLLFCLRRKVQPLPPAEPRTLVRTGARCDARRCAFTCAVCACVLTFTFCKLRFTCFMLRAVYVCMAEWCTPRAGVRPPSVFTRARAHMHVTAAFRCDAQRNFAALPQQQPTTRPHTRRTAAALPLNARNPEWYIEHQPHGIDTPCAVLSARPTPPCVLCACERLDEFEARLIIRACLKGVELHAVCYLAWEAKTNRHQAT